MDMGFQGHAYTWKGRRAEGVLIQEHLDRGLINSSWQEVWPCSVAIHFLDVGFDHCPILILTEGRQEKVSRPFKFEAYWVFDPKCGKEENERRIEQIKIELNETWGQEESFWKQRLRIQWSKEGDSNTAFFHHSTLQRRRRNRVSKIKGVDGVWGENDSQVRKAFEDYFKDLFFAGEEEFWGTFLLL
ncbi:unnamed protein product [Prunus armeniaca]|uniref:Reverse transcriptase zinc-binding domain-containing protein n=1 Tax=Prunus armeniaca TaxID=36596 RepID=A0A6J5X910_PRUAR|nr:unnamed protein product [Prunus armeniaca]